jgi:hypothetical protein
MTRSREDWTRWAERRKARLEADFARELDPPIAGSVAAMNASLQQLRTDVRTFTDRGKRMPVEGRLYPLVLLCQAHGLPEPQPEFQFHPTRGWRADYCWQAQKIIIEIDGGVWTGGRHVRGQGFIEDQRKLNAATLLGYRVLRYTPDRLGEAIEDLREMLG